MTAMGVELFPAGMAVTWPCKHGKKVVTVSGTIILVPRNSTSPSHAEDTALIYVAQFSNGSVQQFSPSMMDQLLDYLLPMDMNDPHQALPKWMGQDQQVMFHQD